MPSIVLEGGALRCLFSAGVMDALLEENMMFPYCIGVSAGISNATSYISRQKERNVIVLEKYRKDSRYIGYKNIFECHSPFGTNFIFREIPDSLEPFDYDAFFAYDGKFKIGVTNAVTGKAEYLDGLTDSREFMMLRASCSIPTIFPVVKINGNEYYDGGLADPIPVRKAIEDGNEKHLIVLTQPKGYKKTVGGQIAISGIMRRKYPEVVNLLLNLHKLYNEQIEFCEQLEREGKAVILRPEYKINPIEWDTIKIRTHWKHGHDMAMENMDKIRSLFD